MSMKLKKNANGELFITFECPHCQAGQRQRAEQIGALAQCTACGGRFTVPGEVIYQQYLDSLKPAKPAPRESRSPIQEAPQIQVEPETVYRETSRPTRRRVEQSSGIYGVETYDDSGSMMGGRYSAADDYFSMTKHDGERVIMQFGPSAAAVVTLQILLGIMTMVWVLFVVFFVFFSKNDLVNRPGVAMGGTFIAVVYTFCMLVLPTLIALLRVMKRKYTISNRRIVSRSGLTSLNVTEILNDKVAGLTIRQSLFGRWFGYGTVNVLGEGTYVRLASVDQPVAVAAAVQAAVETASKG